jgi:hypothetical protein
MQSAQMHNILIFPPKSRKVNIYRYAEVSGEITIGFSAASAFGNNELLSHTFSAAIAEREKLLVDMLIKAGILSHSEAASALATSLDMPIISYLKSFCNKSEEVCSMFSDLAEKVWDKEMSLNQAAVAANHFYTANASVAEALTLVASAGEQHSAR